MKGRIIKTNGEWFITYNDSEGLLQFMPLHPHDVKGITGYSLMFDNVEARISANPDVNFDIIEICQNYGGDHVDKDCSRREGFKQFAKLKK
mgnify:FL=1